MSSSRAVDEMHCHRCRGPFVSRMMEAGGRVLYCPDCSPGGRIMLLPKDWQKCPGCDGWLCKKHDDHVMACGCNDDKPTCTR